MDTLNSSWPQVVPPRRMVVTLPAPVARALADSANTNQRASKRELLRLVIDQLKREGRLPRGYTP